MNAFHLSEETLNDQGKDGWTNIVEEGTSLDGLYPVNDDDDDDVHDDVM
jgi:hypothetical protein